jgi:hypothetical protein
MRTTKKPSSTAAIQNSISHGYIFSRNDRDRDAVGSIFILLRKGSVEIQDLLFPLKYTIFQKVTPPAPKS